MSTAARPVGQPPAVLYDIDWETYSHLLHYFPKRRRFRLTYDRGTLEIMTPFWDHEGPKYLLGRFFDVLTEELRIPCRAGGSVTLRRRRLQRGLEPDNCYWIASAPRVMGKRRLNLRTDPPPDLVIEVDVTHSSLDRMSIYADFKVPEVWRLSSAGLIFVGLKGEQYVQLAKSQSFPQIAPADLVPFLAEYGNKDDTTITAEFRSWVRQLQVNSADAKE
jgi:Uma2 family endonuclease